MYRHLILVKKGLKEIMLYKSNTNIEQKKKKKKTLTETLFSRFVSPNLNYLLIFTNMILPLF